MRLGIGPSIAAPIGGAATALPFWMDGVSIGNRPFTSDWYESSGMCRAQRSENAGHVWVHPDGNGAKILSLRLSDCASRGDWTMTAATPTDKEDIASATVGGQPYVYVGDTGDNGNARATFNIYRVKEPTINGSNGSLAAGTDYETIVCQFPGGDVPAHKDVETLLVDPDTGDIYVVTKRISPAKLYRLAHAASYSGTQTLEALGTIWTPPAITIPANGNNGGYYVGGDISPDGRGILLKSYTDVYYFPRAIKANTTILQALNVTPSNVAGYVGGGRPSSYPNNEPQGEAICWDADNATFYTCGESGNSGDPNYYGALSTRFPINRYTRLAAAITEVAFQDGAAPTAGYAGTADTYIDKANAGTNFGTATTIIVADPDSQATTRIGLLKFDLSAYVPFNASIVGCDLYLFINTEGQDFALYKMLQAWTEASTWTSLGGTILRDDVEAASVADAVHGAPDHPTIPNGPHGYDGIVTGVSSAGNVRVKIPLATIQAWISGAAANNGWILYNLGTTLDGLQFRSSEAATAADRPRLVVRYTQGPVNPINHVNLVRWFSAGDQGALADGAAMSLINDSSSANQDAAQATAANQPTFRAGTAASNYQPTIRFDAVDDFAAFTAVDLAAWTIVVVVKGAAADARILHDEAGGNGFVRLTDATTTRVRAGGGNTVAFTHGARADLDVLVVRSTGDAWLNGVAATPDQGFSANFVANQLGRAANPFAAELAELLIFNSAIGNADVNAIGGFVARRYGKAWQAV